jgi:hypothetical protein
MAIPGASFMRAVYAQRMTRAIQIPRWRFENSQYPILKDAKRLYVKYLG